jgi:hypothetical protein
MACSACAQSLAAAEGLTECAEATIIGGTPVDYSTYLPYVLAGIGTLAFIFLIASGNKKEKAPAKIPAKNK